MIQLAVIADDLTGANDTAVQFAKHKIKSCVRLELNEAGLRREDAGVVVVDTDSRDCLPEVAYQRVETVCAALKNCGVCNLYKKMDSTLRGNLGAELEAAAKVFLPDVVIIAPAFPKNKRITVGGYHFLDGVPIELTEIARAPKSPVHESCIAALIGSQSKTRIGTISLRVVKKGAKAIQAAIAACLDRGEKWIVFDAAASAHLAAIAQAAKRYGRILWAGSAGLAEFLPALYEWTATEKRGAKPDAGAAVIIAGSVSITTQRQMKEALDLTKLRLVQLDVAAFLERSGDEIQRCVREVKRSIDAREDVLLASAVCPADVERAVQAGKRAGISGAAVSEQTASAMGEIVGVLAGASLAGMVLTGGDTAVHVCRALGAEAIEVMEEIAPGIPLGCLVGGKCDGLQVVTKAGAFGERTALVDALRALRSVKTEGEALGE